MRTQRCGQSKCLTSIKEDLSIETGISNPSTHDNRRVQRQWPIELGTGEQLHSFAYTKNSFQETYRHGDGLKYGVSCGTDFDAAVSRLCERIRLRAFPFNLKTFSKNGRRMCNPVDYETVLLMRKINGDFLKLTGIAITNRTRTIEALRVACAEGVPYSVIRLDIRRFYESIDVEDLIRVLNSGIPSAYSIRRYIEDYLRWASKNVSGIPTGLSLSASLAEFYLAKEFDRNVIREEGIHFYKRYVDDIILICSPERPSSDYVKAIEKVLPKGLTLNQDRDKKILVDLTKDKNVGVFDYLGYRYSVGHINKSQELHGRCVALDVSPKKLAKRKTRFVKSLLQFLRDGNEGDLRDRFLLLNSGYTYWDSSRDRVMSAGLCNTYSEIDLPSPALGELQRFYQFCILSRKFSLNARLRLSHLSPSTKRTIISFDLQRHVREKKFFHFSPAELAHLTGCWKDG